MECRRRPRRLEAVLVSARSASPDRPAPELRSGAGLIELFGQRDLQLALFSGTQGELEVTRVVAVVADLEAVHAAAHPDPAAGVLVFSRMRYPTSVLKCAGRYTVSSSSNENRSLSNRPDKGLFCEDVLFATEAFSRAWVTSRNPPAP